MASVEAEHELIQIAEQMRIIDRALVGAQQPALAQGGDAVHGGQQVAGVLSASPGSALTAWFMLIAELLQPPVAPPAVRDDGRTWLERDP